MPFYAACDYDEPDRESYRGIVLINTETNEIEQRFFSGNFIEDYQTYQKWLYENEPYYYEGESIVNFLDDMNDSQLM
ncbi:hypothetical protein ACFFJY_15325 [Fictibacillus aquaticus]|uniref:Uncharacterized protein n=1 Tax=Fictibacillus aquaticus TaxID=2021314 RepID=A0A235FDV1_9BACL|nr:hypothetical protein [Fictibacillus aquaticus]OYD59580.1 hypothetical protein CGZ90_06740 [Fictibacillus aquaticus]